MQPGPQPWNPAKRRHPTYCTGQVPDSIVTLLLQLPVKSWSWQDICDRVEFIARVVHDGLDSPVACPVHEQAFRVGLK